MYNIYIYLYIYDVHLSFVFHVCFMLCVLSLFAKRKEKTKKNGHCGLTHTGNKQLTRERVV